MNGSIPVLAVYGTSLARAWENSLLALDDRGCEIRTEYDAKNPDGSWRDPPSKDCTMMMTVLEPSSEPFIHRAFPGGIEDLEEYRQEVVDGIKDHWCRDENDHEDKRWEYTYHERLTKYEVKSGNGIHCHCPIDQIQDMVDKLAKSPISRRVQAITWQPWKDAECADPPCLQSIWCRILSDEDGVWHLNMNVRMRSWDAYDAAFMNCFAFICYMEQIARRISAKAGREVRLGRFCSIGDSYHIYGRRLQHFEDMFLKQVASRSFEDRTFTRADCEEIFALARPEIAAKVARKDASDKEEKA